MKYIFMAGVLLLASTPAKACLWWSVEDECSRAETYAEQQRLLQEQQRLLQEQTQRQLGEIQQIIQQNEWQRRQDEWFWRMNRRP